VLKKKSGKREEGGFIRRTWALGRGGGGGGGGELDGGILYWGPGKYVN